ncbi:MAG: hypothetical protein H0W30_01560 [Gemmatimonadaceae bacterium]|nr:hypothetical protein [Gemmatimonadaceae bacterium]
MSPHVYVRPGLKQRLPKAQFLMLMRWVAGRAGIRISVNAAALACLVLLTAPGRCLAQMPGQPVIQNAFSNPGITVGVNFGRATDQDVNGFAGAAAWAPSSGKFLFSGGAGIVKAGEGDGVFAWGLRAMLPISLLKLGDSFGVAAFAGGGGASEKGATQFKFPVGASVGYRRAIGSSRGVSAYAAPFYSWSRIDAGDVVATNGSFRVSFGVDITVVRSIGLTVGYETGGQVDAGSAGPLGDVFGVGLSYALRRAR